MNVLTLPAGGSNSCDQAGTAPMPASHIIQAAVKRRPSGAARKKHKSLNIKERLAR